MMNSRGGSKKRKGDSLDAERTLYSTFSSAANSVSQLYTAAVQQTKRAEAQGARQALERIAQFVVKEYGNAPAVPTAVLMEVLRQELQAAQGSAGAAIQLPFPVPLLPTCDSSDAHSDDEHLMSAEPAPGSAFRRSTNGHQVSPPKAGRGGHGQLPAMFQQQQQQQAQQMQQLQQQQAVAAQQMHHQQLMAMQQQQQQQQQPGSFVPPGFQPPF